MVLENQFPDDERVEKEALSLIKAGHEVHLLCATLKKERVGDENSKVLLFSTEGDTDPDRYKNIVWKGLDK